jgi:hypothetical protein
MLGKSEKGSNAGMPIMAIVAAICTLAGIAVIFQVVGSVGSQTGQDHDLRELVDLGAAVENKCQDVAGDAETESVTAISVDVDIRSAAEINKTESQFILDYDDGSDETFRVPNESCTVVMENDTLSTGSYTVQIEHTGESDEGLPKIVVEAY